MASTYLTRTPSSSGNRKTWTFSTWFKRSKIAAGQKIFCVQGDSSNLFECYFNSNDTLAFYHYSSNGGVTDSFLGTNQVFRDTSAWYHLVLAVDTTQGTASNRVKMYINGEQVTSFSSASYFNQNYDTYINWTYEHRIGANLSGALFFNGSMSHIHLIDGTAYTPSAFGSTDSTTGEWKINTSPSVTYGTNGFFILKDGNSVTDASTNSNNFTVGGGTLTKTEDCPSNVFCTMNPLTTTHHTFSNGNLSINGADSKTSVGSLGVNTGKWYWEAKITGSSSYGQYAGATTIENENHWDNAPNSSAANVRTWGGNGNYHNYTQSGSTADSDIISTTGTVYGYALDLDNGTMKYYVNGTLTHTDSTIPSDNSKTFFPVSGTTNSGGGGWQGADYNFGNGYFGTTQITSAGTNASGNGIFEYDVPTGYTALSTKGLNL